MSGSGHRSTDWIDATWILEAATKRRQEQRGTNWIDVTGMIMQGVIVVWLTAVPAVATEHQGVPLKVTAIVADTQSAASVCLPGDWADKVRLVTAS